MKQYILLIADRRTGRVLDARSATDEYSWNIETAFKDLLEKHDLNTVDLIMRHSTQTAQPELIVAADHEPGPDNEFLQPTADVKSTDEDIPF